MRELRFVCFTRIFVQIMFSYSTFLPSIWSSSGYLNGSLNFKILQQNLYKTSHHVPVRMLRPVGPTATSCPNHPTGKWFYNIASHNALSLSLPPQPQTNFNQRSDFRCTLARMFSSRDFFPYSPRKPSTATDFDYLNLLGLSRAVSVSHFRVRVI